MVIQTTPKARYEFVVFGARIPLTVKANTIDAAKRLAIKNGFTVKAIYPK